jgi:hypothetical protein
MYRVNMAEFNIRTDAVDVEQIMRQIRARIQAKRGVDYTEEQIQELANVKLERFLDPKGIRSDLVEQFKRSRERKPDPFQVDQYGFDATMLYGSHRAIVRLMRKLLNPILKLLFNPNTLIQVLHRQTEINATDEKQFHLLRDRLQQRDEVDALYYELVHNLVLELTRVGIENRNLKMRLESLSSRMDFDERRARALEGVVQYRPGTGPARDATPQQTGSQPPSSPQATTAPGAVPDGTPSSPADSTESSTTRRRRRRRRGRRGGRGRTPADAAVEGAAETPSSPDDSPTPPHGDPTGEAALDADSGDDELDPDSESGEDEGPDPSAQ